MRWSSDDQRRRGSEKFSVYANMLLFYVIFLFGFLFLQLQVFITEPHLRHTCKKNNWFLFFRVWRSRRVEAICTRTCLRTLSLKEPRPRGSDSDLWPLASSEGQDGNWKQSRRLRYPFRCKDPFLFISI